MRATHLCWVLAILGGFPVQASTIYGPITNPANGHAYTLLSAGSWTDSESEAITLGGHLATVRNAAENQWLTDNFGQWIIDNGLGVGYLWIGLNDAASEGTFVWSSGEPVLYTNWYPGEPNNTNGIEDYVHISLPGAGRWNDVDNPPTTVVPPFYGIAEVTAPIPEPRTVFLLFLGLVALLLNSRVSSPHDER